MADEQVWSSGSEPQGPGGTDLGEPSDAAPLNQVFSVNVVFQFAIKALTEQPLLVLFIGGAQFAVQLIPSLISTPLQLVIVGYGAANGVDEDTMNAVSQLVSFVITFAFFPLVMLVQAGGIVATAHWLRTGTLDFSKMFTSVGPAVNALLYGLLVAAIELSLYFLVIVPFALVGYALGDVIGLLLGLLGGIGIALIPGIYVGLGLGMGTYVSILEKDGPVAAVGRSWSLTDGGRLTLFVTGFAFGLLGFFVGCFTCGLGAIPLTGMQVVGMTVAYLCMTRPWALQTDFVKAAAPQLG